MVRAGHRWRDISFPPDIQSRALSSKQHWHLKLRDSSLVGCRVPRTMFHSIVGLYPPAESIFLHFPHHRDTPACPGQCQTHVPWRATLPPWGITDLREEGPASALCHFVNVQRGRAAKAVEISPGKCTCMSCLNLGKVSCLGRKSVSHSASLPLGQSPGSIQAPGTVCSRTSAVSFV